MTEEAGPIRHGEPGGLLAAIFGKRQVRYIARERDKGWIVDPARDGEDLAIQLQFERVNGIANAYKHASLDKPSHVIHSFDDVLVVGLGYGLDGYGVGKMGGIEVLVRDKTGVSWKFMGDAPVVVAAWFRYLGDSGAALPTKTYSVCGIQVHP